MLLAMIDNLIEACRRSPVDYSHVANKSLVHVAGAEIIAFTDGFPESQPP